MNSAYGLICNFSIINVSSAQNIAKKHYRHHAFVSCITRLLSLLCLTVIMLAVRTDSASATPPLHLDAPRNFTTGDLPSEIIKLDMDMDGDNDIAVKCTGLFHTELQLFENRGDGVLSLHSTITLLSNSDLVTADINQDGRMDLLQVHPTDSGGSELLVLIQNGDFSFGSTTTALPFPATNLCTGDMDHINGPDLVIGDDGPHPLTHVLLNNGSGSFAMHGTYETEQEFRDADGDGIVDAQTPINMMDCQCSDINGDGNLDIVVTNSIQRVVSGNTAPGCGSFRECIIQCDDSHCAEDCLKDFPPNCILHVHSITALLNDGLGGMGPFQIIQDTFAGSLGIGDMDGDNDNDVVTTGLALTGTDKYDVILVRNQGDGTFTPAERFASHSGTGDARDVEISDIDSDGDLDIGIMLLGPVPGNPNDISTDQWALFRNDGTGHFNTPEIYPAGADIFDLEFAELNGETGDEALTAAADDNRLSVYYNEQGGFKSPMIINIIQPGTSGDCEIIDMCTGDFNNDGLMDIAAILDYPSFGGDDQLVLINGPLSNMPAQIFTSTNSMPHKMIAAQIIGSEADDIAITYMGPPMGVAIKSLDTGVPVQKDFVSLNGLPEDLSTLDVNGDGILDLAVLRIRQEGITAGISILSVSADGSMTYLGDLILGSDNVLDFDSRLPYAITTTDMNGDGIKDIVAVTSRMLGSSIVSVILNRGDLHFELAGEYETVPRTITDITGADFNGDGLNDIALTSISSQTDPNSDTVEILFNLGGGILGNPLSYNVGSGATRIAAAQMDGQAGIDIVVSLDGSNEITLLLNDGSGAFPNQESYLCGGGCDGVTLSDIDGDGDADPVIFNDNHFVTQHQATVSIINNRTINSVVCPGDLDMDGDIDGTDIYLWTVNPGSLSTELLASNFGKENCS